jgi:hypothetical protein
LDKAEYIYTVDVLSGKVSAKSSCPLAWKLAALVPDISEPARADHTGIATYRNSISTSTQIPLLDFDCYLPTTLFESIVYTVRAARYISVKVHTSNHPLSFMRES